MTSPVIPFVAAFWTLCANFGRFGGRGFCYIATPLSLVFWVFASTALLPMGAPSPRRTPRGGKRLFLFFHRITKPERSTSTTGAIGFGLADCAPLDFSDRAERVSLQDG